MLEGVRRRLARPVLFLPIYPSDDPFIMFNRARQCPQPGACPGLGSETEFCNQEPCPDWGEWGEWSSCSVTCGGGQRVRNRFDAFH